MTSVMGGLRDEGDNYQETLEVAKVLLRPFHTTKLHTDTVYREWWEGHVLEWLRKRMPARHREDLTKAQLWISEQNGLIYLGFRYGTPPNILGTRFKHSLFEFSPIVFRRGLENMDPVKLAGPLQQLWLKAGQWTKDTADAVVTGKLPPDVLQRPKPPTFTIEAHLKDVERLAAQGISRMAV